MDGNFYPTFEPERNAFDGSEFNSTNCDFAARDARLIANGYEPVAVNGKRALGSGWSTRPNTFEAITAERVASPSAVNTGLRTGRLVGVDIDLCDPVKADAMQTIAFEVLGKGPMVRVGAKGAMLVYGNETPIPKITITDSPVGERKRRTLVEILGIGQQFVAYGTHPDTGKQYEWIGGHFHSPVHLPRDELPEVTPTKLHEFARRAGEKLAAWGYCDIVVTDACDPERHAQRGREQRKDRYPVPREYLTEMLSHIDPGCDRRKWVGCLGGIQATNLAEVSENEVDAALGEIAVAWSRGDYWSGEGPANYVDDSDVKRNFYSLNPAKIQGTGFGTLYHAARENGWNRSPPQAAERFLDLTAEAEVRDGGRIDQEGPVDILRSTVPEPSPLTRDMLPKVIADYAFDVAERIGVDPAIVACPMLVVCASALDDRIKVQPKEYDDSWTESARLNVLIAAGSGSNKTAALNAATAPFKKIELQWRDEDNRAFAEWEHRNRMREAAIKHMEREIRQKGEPVSEEKQPFPPVEDRPRRRRLVMNDTTAEGVCKLLADNPRGILLEVDEAIGWLRSFDVYRNGAGGKDRAFWLQADNGGPFGKDRADDKNTVFVPNLSVCVVGGIQPEKLRQIAAEFIDDGFLQRSFVITAADARPDVDREPDREAGTAYERLLTRLLGILGASGAITLSPEAHQYRLEIDAVIRALIELPTTKPPFAQHLSKWRGRFARLLLTFHAIECASSDRPLGLVISGETAGRVRDFMLGYLLPQQVWFYGTYFDDQSPLDRNVLWIARYILAHSSTRVTLSELKRHSHMHDRPVEEAMELLTDDRWVGPRQEGARRSISWEVNETVHTRFAKQAAEAKAQLADKKAKMAAAGMRVANSLHAY
jgi:hypothetical protein